MNARNINPSDVKYLMNIWSMHFKHEFDFPDFLNGYACNFVITNESDEIVVAGGVKPLMESVLITDLNMSVEDRYDALSKALEISSYTCNKLGIDQLHAFVQNPSWRDRLVKTGFQPTKGRALYLGV